LIVNEHLWIGSISYVKIKTFKYLGSLVTNRNSAQEEITFRLEAGNACYYSFQTLLSCRLLSKNLKIGIYKTTTLPDVLYGCEAWSLTFREERRLRVLENRRRIFLLKMGENVEWRRLHIEECHSLNRSPNQGD
jgi:Type IIA topoisomerase (DNA gyrase/topo II, topoisomerase IV), B subunit